MTDIKEMAPFCLSSGFLMLPGWFITNVFIVMTSIYLVPTVFQVPCNVLTKWNNFSHHDRLHSWNWQRSMAFLFIFDKDFGVGYNSRRRKGQRKVFLCILSILFHFSAYCFLTKLTACRKGINLRISVLFLLPEIAAIYPQASSILSLTISKSS